MKIDRIVVHQKYNGHCAYCGREITAKEMHIDHIIPKFHNREDLGFLVVDGHKFTDYKVNDTENLNPACRVCNLWKSTHTIEEFRHELEMQISRLRQYSASFRLAERYNLITPTDNEVIFYFETRVLK
ncbi:MAG: HNH endonuclease [Smithella sp.]|jgi:5-methylcytosine-specific restriction endonuclease McrA